MSPLVAARVVRSCWRPGFISKPLRVQDLVWGVQTSGGIGWEHCVGRHSFKHAIAASTARLSILFLCFFASKRRWLLTVCTKHPKCLVDSCCLSEGASTIWYRIFAGLRQRYPTELCSWFLFARDSRTQVKVTAHRTYVATSESFNLSCAACTPKPASLNKTMLLPGRVQTQKSQGFAGSGGWWGWSESVGHSAPLCGGYSTTKGTTKSLEASGLKRSGLWNLEIGKQKALCACRRIRIAAAVLAPPRTAPLPQDFIIVPHRP